jgi:hypothetical protein
MISISFSRASSGVIVALQSKQIIRSHAESFCEFPQVISVGQTFAKLVSADVPIGHTRPHGKFELRQPFCDSASAQLAAEYHAQFMRTIRLYTPNLHSVPNYTTRNAPLSRGAITYAL